MGSEPFLPMNVTTKKSECDPRQRIRQLEVAIEHAIAAAKAATALKPYPTAVHHTVANVQANYPSFELRATLKFLCPTGEDNGEWTVLTLEGADAQERACKAACTVLRHYYPDEDFTVASPVETPARDVTA